jgi:CRP/FNR family cyclic AMP-dependent transcriptional regulator
MTADPRWHPVEPMMRDAKITATQRSLRSTRAPTDPTGGLASGADLIVRSPARPHGRVQALGREPGAPEKAGRATLRGVLRQLGLPDAIVAAASSAPSRRCQLVDFPERHRIFDEGDPPDWLYILVSGAVKLRNSHAGQHALLTVVGPPEVFGAVSVIDSSPRMASAITMSPVRAVAIAADALSSIIAENPALAEQLLRMLARRVQRTNDEINDLVFSDGPGRVAKRLLQLAQWIGTEAGGDVRVVHGLTQSELGQLAGATRETVSKALSNFATRGWIKIGRESVLIVDPDRLARRAM